MRIFPPKWKAGIQGDICTPVFIAVLFTIAKMWKQPKCPLVEEWIYKMYINAYSGEQGPRAAGS